MSATTRFVDRLSASLAAIGSAQGFLRVFITDDSKASAPAAVADAGGGGLAVAEKLTSPWLAAPMVRYVSTFNGHMLWFVASLLLQGLGSYNKKAVYYVQQPGRLSAYAKSGLQGGLVTGSLADLDSYTVSLALDFEGGKMVKHTKTFRLGDFIDKAPSEDAAAAPPAGALSYIPAPHALHPTLCTQHPASYTLRPTPYTLCSGPSLDPRPHGP